MSILTSAPQRPDRRALDHTDRLRIPPLDDRAPRTSLLDRLALRIALRLLLWSTRPTASAADVERQRARAEREQQWLRRYLHLPHA